MPTSYVPCPAEYTPNVHALKRGDERAFRCLYYAEHERLRRFVTKIIRDYDEAENIVQETFTEAYRQIDRFRGESKVSTWLFSIARHLAYGYLRKTKRHSYMEHETIEFLHAEQGGQPAESVEHVEQGERRRVLRAAINRLPDHYRRIVEMRDLQEHSTEETAEKLGLSSVNVRVRLHRARKKLRDELGTIGPVLAAA